MADYRRKTVMEDLQAEIRNILQEYQDEVQVKVTEIAEEVAKKGAKALRKESAKQFGNYAYAKGWTVFTERVRSSRYGLRLYTIVYNKDEPQIAHLLEHGHVTRNGTEREMPDTPAHEHIAPIEQEMIETFQREVVSKL